MLEIKNINKNFGGLRAVNNASMKIEKGSITGLNWTKWSRENNAI